MERKPQDFYPWNFSKVLNKFLFQPIKLHETKTIMMSWKSTNIKIQSLQQRILLTLHEEIWMWFFHFQMIQNHPHLNRSTGCWAASFLRATLTSDILASFFLLRLPWFRLVSRRWEIRSIWNCRDRLRQSKPVCNEQEILVAWFK